MHEPVKGRLEEYLRGGGSASVEAEAHLRNCEECRRELQQMKAQAALFRALKSPAGLEVSPGFYARVMDRVESGAKPSAWSLFGESLFAKRLAYASITFVVLLGSFFVSSTESQPMVVESGPEVILAGQELPQRVTMDPKDREVILVNLATYEQDFQ